MKFLRVIRFDQSDEHVFARPAQVDETAISGGFEFSGITRADLKGKTRQAFSNGFLGLPSFGRSTFAAVGEITGEDEMVMIDALVTEFLLRYGAPDREAAERAAKDEIAFTAELCLERPVNTVFSLSRRLEEDGQIRESYREIAPPDGKLPHAVIWDVVDDGN